MSVLMCREEESKETPKCPLLSQDDSASPRSKHLRGRETVHREATDKDEVVVSFKHLQDLFCCFVDVGRGQRG